MAELTDSQDNRVWTLVYAQSRVRNLPLVPEVPLHNRYDALGLKKGDGVNNNSGNSQDPGKGTAKGGPANHMYKKQCHRKKRNEQRVLVIGHCSLRGTEALICHPDSILREVCCLPEACIHDITKRILSLVKPEDYHPFLLFHIGTTEAATRRL